MTVSDSANEIKLMKLNQTRYDHWILCMVWNIYIYILYQTQEHTITTEIVCILSRDSEKSIKKWENLMG